MQTVAKRHGCMCAFVQCKNFFNKALTIKKDFKIKLDKKSVTVKLLYIYCTKNIFNTFSSSSLESISFGVFIIFG